MIDDDGPQQLGYLTVMGVGIAVIAMPAAFQFIYSVFALPTLWELTRRHDSH